MFWEKFGKQTMPLFLLFAVSFSALPALGKYGGGTGEPNDPYLIFDANQMNAIGADANDWDKHFKLMADIDLSAYKEEEFNIIGYKSLDPYEYYPFRGVFDGNGHTISNFTYVSNNKDYIGLFGVVTYLIKNLGLIDPNVDAGMGSYVGSLVGSKGGTVTGCYVEGGSVRGYRYIGGLAGYNNGTITNCYATCDVSGDEYVGGLVGNNPGTIINCYSI
ncbi:MAG: GLUG motif-containing protein, partial [Planctomycetota bacterium]